MKFGLFESIVTFALTLSVTSQQRCPDYATYAQSPQGNPSTGPLALPYMRPDPACRTFHSPFVEKVIEDMKSRLKDPDLARLFENTFPNTLDTTIKYFNATANLAFIVTGDITAQWLRDTGGQFFQYRALIGADKGLATLIKAVINTEARYIAEYPYCGAFQPPPESGLKPSHNPWADGVIVNPPVNKEIVFECKYEIDSLCSFLKLSRTYYHATNDSSIMNDNWHKAVNQIFRVIDEQTQATFDKDFNVISYYNWTGGNGALSPAVPNHGNGEPKGYTGMVGTHHRPSDDISIFAFSTPANAMLSVELNHLAVILEAAKQSEHVGNSARAKFLSGKIREAIIHNTIQDNVFAYETNGLGSRLVMDDANVPSLLALPYLEFLERDDEIYVTTRKMVLSRQNPYFAVGRRFSGIGERSAH